MQYDAGGDLTAADSGNQFLKVRDLADVCRLVDEAAHMDGQLAAEFIVRFLAQEVEKLAVDHGDQEIEGAVRIAHDEKQRRFLRIALFLPPRVSSSSSS